MIARAKLLLGRQRRHVQAREAVRVQLAKDREVAVAAENLKATQPVRAEYGVLEVVAAFGPVRIADLEGLGFLHSGEASLNLELPIDLAILVPIVDKIFRNWHTTRLLSGSLGTHVLLRYLGHLLLLWWAVRQPRGRPNLESIRF